MSIKWLAGPPPVYVHGDDVSRLTINWIFHPDSLTQESPKCLNSDCMAHGSSVDLSIWCFWKFAAVPSGYVKIAIENHHI